MDSRTAPHPIPRRIAAFGQLAVLLWSFAALAVEPLPQAHSHNDYEHSRPLADALDHGFCSVEADIFLVDGELLVAHDRPKVEPGRTLQKLYLDPLLARVSANHGRVYPNGPSIVLLVDIKGDADSTYARLREVLEPYRSILTVFSSGKTETNAVTVILSGNRPWKTMEAEPMRLAGLDGRLPDLERNPSPHLVPLVSDHWGTHFRWNGEGPLPPEQQSKLQSTVQTAHRQGRRIRFWGAADTPAVWTAHAAAGVDLINTDHLPELAAHLRFSAVHEIGTRLEWFADGRIVERLDGASLRLHSPQPAGIALRFDNPWEGAFSGYATVIHDTDHRHFHLYYRGLPVAGADGSTNEVTCYASSPDGIQWTRPALGLFEVFGTRSNNVILAHQAPFSHNFAPFLDSRAGTPPGARFKAVAGTSATGLHGFTSPDGIRWSRLLDRPLITRGAFDSQNVAFWSTTENRYLLYLRTWTQGEFRGIRTISRSTSTNFIDWTEPVPLSFGTAPIEHLYTSQTHPYFRAPHFYLATPMRFLPGRQVLTPEQAKTLGVDPGYVGDVAETVLMTSRDGSRFDRLFMEGFIRPGPELGNWASRAGLSALGIIPTGPHEISLFKQASYAQPGSHLTRYTLRTDGFVSAHGPYQGGTILTRLIRPGGQSLVVNFATGASGGLKTEFLAPDGSPIPGFSGVDSLEIAGDSVERVIPWKAGADTTQIAGRPIRIRFSLRDADLYSFQFR